MTVLASTAATTVSWAAGAAPTTRTGPGHEQGVELVRGEDRGDRRNAILELDRPKRSSETGSPITAPLSSRESCLGITVTGRVDDGS